MNIVKVNIGKYHLESLDLNRVNTPTMKLSDSNVFVVRVKPDIKLDRDLYRKLRKKGFVEKDNTMRYVIATKEEFKTYYKNIKIPVMCKFLIIPIGAFQKSPFRLKRKYK